MTLPGSARETAQACRGGRISPVDTVEAALERIARTDPEIRAFLHVDGKGARERARELAAHGPPSEGKGLLFGVPVAVKDNICVAGMPMTCGSRILEGYVPPYHATVVERLLREGGIVVGKTNLDAFGMGASTEYSAFHPTHNPAAPGRVPGGSSGGSAAAVAAGMVPLALGTDTGGSVRQPAAFCGCVGFRPTYGAVSRYGLTAFASSLDQAGPLARNTEDAALLFQVLAGPDERDATSRADLAPAPPSPLPPDPSSLRVGMVHELFPPEVEHGIRACVTRAFQRMEASGIRVWELSLPLVEEALPAYHLLAAAEASSNLARFDGLRYGPREEGIDPASSLRATRSLRFGEEVKRRILAGTFTLRKGYVERLYLQALRLRRALEEGFRRLFREVDILAGPTSSVRPFQEGARLHDPLVMYACDRLTVPAALARLPALSIPCGTDEDGLPVGLQLMGPPGADRAVLAAGRCLESLLRPPSRRGTDTAQRGGCA